MCEKKSNQDQTRPERTNGPSGEAKSVFNAQKPIKRGYQPTDTFENPSPPKPDKGTEKSD